MAITNIVTGRGRKNIGSVTVGEEPVLVVAENPLRAGLVIRNIGVVRVYFDGQGQVNPYTPFYIDPGEFLNDTLTMDDWWAWTYPGTGEGFLGICLVNNDLIQDSGYLPEDEGE